MISEVTVEYIPSLEPDITLKIPLLTVYMFTKKVITTFPPPFSEWSSQHFSFSESVIAF
jgi:hypothetical protein